MSAPRGTTPTFTLSFTEPSLDLTSAAHVYVTFRNNTNTVTKQDTDLTIAEKSVTVTLSQAETLAFLVDSFVGSSTCDIQVNWTDISGGRAASEVVKYTFDKQILDEVVS